jgi:pimeloyl-ACP methyl ester carboxylesterase
MPRKKSNRSPVIPGMTRPLPRTLPRTICTIALVAGALAAQQDASPHSRRYVTVDGNVRLEVLDWGGSGRPVVLLAGLGNDAHAFDAFAPKLTRIAHVYGITRRGFGASDAPASGYSAERLGDDVLEAVAVLGLEKPVLVGHSIAGEELSSVGSRFPEKVAGLVYLDAGYGYAFYDRGRGDLNIDLAELQRKLEEFRQQQDRDTRPLIQELLETVLPGFERDLRQERDFLGALPPAMLAPHASRPKPHASEKIAAGETRFTTIPVPVLAIFAVPHDMGAAISNDPVRRAAFDAEDLAATGAQADAFEAGVPSARVVRLPHASHYVFRSNEADVLREIEAFLKTLPNP